MSKEIDEDLAAFMAELNRITKQYGVVLLGDIQLGVVDKNDPGLTNYEFRAEVTERYDELQNDTEMLNLFEEVMKEDYN